MIDLRKTLLATGFLALAACGGEPAGTTTPALPALDTIEVTAASNGAGSRWDGVVEAVRQAELTAQTAGRVTAVLVDVNTRVAQGQVLLRLSAVEQQAGANTARDTNWPPASALKRR